MGILGRRVGTEKERRGCLLLGSLLGLDKWLLGIPRQFLLTGLGHIDLGFDPKNEIIRVYAYLGEERTPVKQWLASVLWHDLMYNMGGLVWGGKYQALIGRVRECGISAREWMDDRLEENRASDSTDSLEG